MAFVDIVPVSGSIISRGAIITVRWDTQYLPNIIYRPTSGPDEPISVPATSGPKLGSGYTGEYSIDTSGPTNIFSIAFKRDAGWTNSGFVISVFDFWTGVDTLSNYTILAEGQYPPDMQPFTDPAEGAGEGTIQVLNSGVLLGSAASINFDDNLVAVLNGDTATIDGEAGGGGNTVGSVSGTIGIWNKGNVVTDPFNVLTTAQNFDVNNGTPLLTTKIRVASIVPLEGIQAYLTLGNIPAGYLSFQDKTDPGVTATTFEILSATATGGSYADLTVNYVAGSGGAWSTNPYILVFTPKAVPGGVVDFTDLGDVVQSYSGAAGKLVRVNAGEFGLEYVAPGTVAGGEEVVGEVWVDGLGNAGFGSFTSGIASAEIDGQTVKLTWSTPFAETVYFIQLTQNAPGGAGYTFRPVLGSRKTDSVNIQAETASGSLINMASTGTPMVFDIIAQAGPSAGNVGRGMASFAYTGQTPGPGAFTTTGGTLGSDITELYFGSKDDVDEDVEQSMIATQDGDIIWLRARSTQKFLAWTMTGSASGPGAFYTGLVSVDGGTNSLVLDETYDVGFIESGASGDAGDTDLNSVITVAPINNVVNIPSGDPLILRDGGVTSTIPLTLTKLAPQTLTPVLSLHAPGQGTPGIWLNSTTGNNLVIYEDAIVPFGSTASPLTFGEGQAVSGVVPGDVRFVGRPTLEQDQKAGTALLLGGDNTNATSGDGGDVVIDGGTFTTSGVNGDIRIGTQSPNEISFGQGFTVAESTDPPLAVTPDNTGQFWVNSATSPPKPYFTGDDDIDIDLTAGSGVGDVTSTSAIAANKIVIGDDGAKGVKEAPLGSLSDAGALTAIATIDTTGNITAGADLIATAALDVGTSAVIATNLTMTTGDIAMSAGATVDGIDVGTAVPLNTDHAALVDEHIDWSVTGATQVHIDRYSPTAGGDTNTVAGDDIGIENTGDNTDAVLTPIFNTTTGTIAEGDHVHEGVAIESTGEASDRILVTDGAAGFIYEAKPTGSGTPAESVATSDASAGVIGGHLNYARQDHEHQIVTTGTPEDATPGDTAEQGIADSLARRDHKHGLPDFGITDTTFCVGDDARLSDTRTPSAHSLGGAEHGSTTLYQLSALIGDDDLIGDLDSRLSDNRTADAVATSGADVVQGTTPPTANQVIKATSATASAWTSLVFTDISGALVAGNFADDTIAVSKLASATDGELITWDSGGVATTVAAGTAGHVLTSAGADAEPSFQATVKPSLSKSITVADPMSSETVDLWVTPVAITITKISYFARGITQSVAFDVSHGTDPDTLAVIDSTGWTATTTTIVNDSTFSGGDVTVVADSVVAVELGTVSGTDVFFHITVHYTED
jgi:hypothetical protein